MEIEELRAAAVLSKFTLAQQEKDYYQCKILSWLSDKGGLVFKGGTALQKAHGLPRFSEDLDFDLAGEELDLRERLKRLAGWLGQGGERTLIKDYHNTTQSASARLSIEGILFRQDPRGRCGLEIDISLREKTELKPDVLEIAPRYPDIAPFLFAVMKPQEIAAEKVRALFSRKKARDLYDLHFLLCKKGVELDRGLVEGKLWTENIKYDRRELERRIDGLEKVWKSELGALVGVLPEFGKVTGEVKKKL